MSDFHLNPWFGEAPAKWQRGQLKRFYSVRLGKMLQPTQSSPRDELVPYMRAANVAWDGANIGDVKRMWASPTEVRDIQLEINDLLVSEGGDVGRSCLWNGEIPRCIFQNAINRVRSRSQNSTKFLYYVMKAVKDSGWIDIICNKATIAHFTAEKLSALEVPLPFPDEQRRIASYLDEQTAKIDQLMDMRRRQMALLKEQRAALIQEAVTRGLNPNVPMKDSGLPWLGEIPAHWELTRAKFVSKIFVPQRNKPDLNEDEGYYWVTMEEMSNPIIDSAAYRVSDADLTNAGSRILPSGAIIASCVGNFGAASINAVPVVINQQLQAFIPHRINNEFLRLLITISASYFEMIATAATLVYVNQDGFANLPVPLPPVDEQVDIIDFIASESTRFDTIHASYTRQFTLLAEYRAALIHECVTGQRTLGTEPHEI